MEGKARELLKAIYLKPLREAEREMSSGRSSRISQILSHPVLSDRDCHRLKEILSIQLKAILESLSLSVPEIHSWFRGIELTVYSGRAASFKA